MPSARCLTCDGCCRFREAGTCWQPKITPEEKQQAARVSPGIENALKRVGQKEGALPVVPHEDYFICHFFSPPNNACGIYSARPFECRLYPFLLLRTAAGPRLGVHLLCPHVAEARGTESWTDYLKYLKGFLAGNDTSLFLSRHPELFGAYPSADSEIEVLFSVDINKTKS